MKRKFNVRSNGKKVAELELNLKRLIIVGYSGSNLSKIKEHIKELKEKLNVPEPKKIPTIFECSSEILSLENKIKFIGNMTSGEVEYVIIKKNKEIFIGVGSDHTDRNLESISVIKSKQVCPKPIGKNIWRYEDIKGHWNEIEVESYQEINGEKILYQKGKLVDILDVDKILQELTERIGELEEAIIFSGTVPLVDKFKYGNKFIGKLIDKKNKDEIEVVYDILEISEEER